MRNGTCVRARRAGSDRVPGLARVRAAMTVAVAKGCP
jgi:hypothetical protein